MKFKINISALLMALLVFVASNGIALSEHICNSSGTHGFSLFANSGCKMEKKVSSCCANKVNSKKSCCENKQFFKKLSVEGFTAKQIVLKPFEKLVPNDFWINYHSFNYSFNFNRNITGIPPPDNLFTIKYLLRPTPVGLQTFRC